MPYTLQTLPDNIKQLPDNKKKQWLNVWNSAYARCMQGKSGDDAQKTCETFAFKNANGVANPAKGNANNSAGFSADDLAPAPASQVAEFELPSQPGAAYDDGETVYRYGRLFRAGVYPDKAFEMTPDEIRKAVDAFKEPVPIDIEHVPSVLDGKLGQVVHVEASDDGEELHGIVALPKWLDSVLDERKVSSTWDRTTKTLRALALVRSPRVSDAALMAAFTQAGPCDECDKSGDEALASFAEVTTEDQYRALSQSDKLAIYYALVDKRALAC